MQPPIGSFFLEPIALRFVSSFIVAASQERVLGSTYKLFELELSKKGHSDNSEINLTTFEFLQS
jgi:hypothetical protein